MTTEVNNLVFCIDKNNKLKLVVSESNGTISFFELVNDTLQIVQKYYEPSLKTYCLYYSPSIRKILSGHNGKIIIWKTSLNTIHKHFQVSKGDKILDNFRISVDSSGVMFATSNNDKNIRIRAIHDGKLLCRIPVAESISDLFFILNDKYIIATSVEGYIYFYKINQNFITKLKRDKELINSMEEKNVINNKLILLQKLSENDVSVSKNEKMKNLAEKLEKSEDISYEDLKTLNEFVIESKKTVFTNDDIIQLKEDKPNNNDDLDNQNNVDIDNNENDNKMVLSKSKLFEKNLKENNSNKKINNMTYKNNNKNKNRISIIDDYIKKSENKNHNNKNFKKVNTIDLDSINSRKYNLSKDTKRNKKDNKIYIIRNHVNPFLQNASKTETNLIYVPSISGIKNSNKKTNKINSTSNVNNDRKNSRNSRQKKNFNRNYNIFIKSNNNNRMNSFESSPNNITYKKKIFETEINNTYDCNSSRSNKKNNKLNLYRNTSFSIKKKDKNKLNNNKLIINKYDFKIIIQKNKFNNKKELIQEIDNIKLDNINKRNDLLLLENKLEILRDKIRMKLGTYVKDTQKEKLLDKFGILLMEKINKIQK
jgi:hypothetical protein